MKILLTGANSYVGARIFLDLEKDFDIVGTYNNTQLSKKFIKLDLTSSEDIKQVLHEQKPDIIIHAAANANARWCEAHPEEAYALNETATKAIVESANDIHAKIIYISSFTAINPVNVYGKTKHLSEEHIKETKAGYAILRPSIIFGFSPNITNDRPFNRILKNLDEKTPAIYDTSWKFQPTYIGQISEIIKHVIDQNIVNKTIPIAISEIKSRYDIAKDILQAFGIEVTPADLHDQTPSSITDLSLLQPLGLPQYTYQEMIEKIIKEIQHRENFTLS